MPRWSILSWHWLTNFLRSSGLGADSTSKFENFWERGFGLFRTCYRVSTGGWSQLYIVWHRLGRWCWESDLPLGIRGSWDRIPPLTDDRVSWRWEQRRSRPDCLQPHPAVTGWGPRGYRALHLLGVPEEGPFCRSHSHCLLLNWRWHIQQLQGML